ncbi:Sec-independent protein translocase protein TatB [Lawsonella clevelandensis]|uniref:Sec-independent protein translocase protein TatB n=1 Tax=Lawsonella clevelandensis TaxID=1528099 RepID=UPI00290D31D6|nr:Sec-independent protein translocase protein TatB [Lawsonella clevelandensis]MDU7193522.1 Sec-independent protein translocase protein TatB [Lawsonella clevelandensis]
MFSNVGWGEILVILVVAVVILGPDRLPEATRHLAKGLRKLRDWVNNAQGQLKENVDEDFGDLKDLQKPVKEIARIKAMGPKAAAVHYLLDDDDSILDVDLGVKDLTFDLKELTGLNELDESPFQAAPEQPVRGPHESAIDASSGATTHVHADPASAPTAGWSGPVSTPQQAAFSSDSLAHYRPQQSTSGTVAPGVPLTVGDSWEEAGADEVEISFDDED